MTPVNGPSKPCRPAGRYRVGSSVGSSVGGSSVGGSTSSTSDTSSNNTSSDGKKNVENTGKNGRNDNTNGHGIHSGGRPAQAVQPALPLRYVQKTATEPAHYVFPRPAKAATQPGKGGVKEGRKEEGNEKQKEKKKGKERERKPKDKEKGAQKVNGKEVDGPQQAKAKASRPRVPTSPTMAHAAVHPDIPHKAGNPNHVAAAAAAAAAASTATDTSSRSTEAALLTPKPSSQATNESGHAGNQTQIHANGPAPAKPAHITAPTGEATLQHSRESAAETSAQTDGAAAHHYEPQHPQDTSPQPGAPSRNGQGMRPSENQPANPSFRPTPPDQLVGFVTNGYLLDGPQPPMPTGPRTHQAHPSNASGPYGPFHGSQNSESPGPPLVGGLPPPPGMHFTNGRAPHMMHPNGHGFPPVPLFGTDMIHGSGFDNFPRPGAMPFGGPMDYRPHGNAFDHSNPHSFPGSQSSVHPEDNGMYPRYPPGLRNGAARSGEDRRGAPRRNYGSQDYGRMGPNTHVPFREAILGDNPSGLVAHIQRQFSCPEFADCCLELRYVDDRAPPVRVPGHRVMLSRSLRLADLVRKQSFQAGPADGTPPTILLETASIWIRSDSFYMALKHLYGLPMMRALSRPDEASADETTSARWAVDQVDFAISFAAAGHLLVDEDILRRGCEVAAQSLSWQTLERVLAFALEDYSDKGGYETYRYGEGSGILLKAVVAFIVQNFPSDFSLNVDSGEPVPFARFTVNVMPSPPAPPSAGSEPSSSRSEASERRKTDRSKWRLSDIQFGDLPCAKAPEDEMPSPPPPPPPPPVPAPAPPSAQPASHSILSRILLDIPFPQLKMILESSGTGNVQAWANAESRYKIIKSAVDEREARRRRALRAVLAGRDFEMAKVREGLRKLEPQDLGPWTAVGWQEDVLPYGNANGPSLGRKWAPITQPPTGPAPAHP